MRPSTFTSFLTVFALSISSVVSTAVDATKQGDTFTIDGWASEISALEARAPIPYVPHTNAERFALGMPPMPPTRRATRTAGARRQSPSGTPSVTGYILAKDTSGNSLGYVSQVSGSTNHFGLTPLTSSALAITLPAFTSTATLQTEINIGAATTYASSWPYMGGIVGVVNTDNNLYTTNTNYAYIQGVSASPGGSPAAAVSNSYPSLRDSESAIWSYDTTTNAITPQWTNTDGSQPITNIVWIPGSSALVLTGDFTAFNTEFGPSQEATFTFVTS